MFFVFFVLFFLLVSLKGCVCKAKTEKQTHYPHNEQPWVSLPCSPHLQVLLSLLGSLFPPLFKIGCTCKIFMYLYINIYIYTVYVIVEHEMWLLHFIFEGLFVYFFQNCRKRCYIETK